MKKRNGNNLSHGFGKTYGFSCKQSKEKNKKWFPRFALKELRSNSQIRVALFACAAIFACIVLPALLTSCASTPVEKSENKIKVNAFDTLEHDSHIYIRIPVKAHDELTRELLKALVGDDIPNKYFSAIIESLDFIYMGMGSAKDKERVQIACDAKVPMGIKMALSSADNWSGATRNIGDSGKFTVYTEKSSNMELCVPSGDLILISNNLEKPLALYYENAIWQELEANLAHAESEYVLDKNVSSKWKQSEIYDFIGNATTENVRLYIQSPISFVTRLLGVSLSTSIFQLNFIEVEMRLLPNGKYGIDIDMEFSKSGLVQRAASFLNVAFLLTDSTVSVIDGTHLHVSDIQVSTEQLQKMLGF